MDDAPANAESVAFGKKVGAALGWAAALVGVKIAILPDIAQVSTIIVLLTALTVGFAAARNDTYRIKLVSFDVAFMLFLSSYLVVEIINTSDIIGRRPALGAIAGLAVPFIAARIARRVVKSWVAWVAFTRGLAIPGAIVAGIALLQFAQFPGINQLLVRVVPNDGLSHRIAVGDSIRATSTIGHWSALGGYLCVISAVVCGLLIYSKRRHSIKRSDVWLLIILCIGQLTTVTFATIALQALVVGSTLVAIKVKPHIVASIAAAFGVSWWLFGRVLSDRVAYQSAGTGYLGTEFQWVPETIAYRIYLWGRETIPGIELRPLTGWGADIYSNTAVVRPPTLTWLSPESEWMRTAISAGLVILFLQIAIVMCAWRRSVIGRNNEPWVRPIQMVFAGIVSISFIHSHLSNAGVPLILWTVMMSLPRLSSGWTRPKRSIDLHSSTPFENSKYGGIA